MTKLLLVVALFLSVQGCKWLGLGKKDSPTPSAPTQPAKLPVESVVEELESRYQFSQQAKAGVKMSDAERKLARDLAKDSQGKDDKFIEQQLRKWVAAYPSSVEAQSTFGRHLIKQDRLKDAESYLASALKNNPQDLRLRMLSDSAKEIASAKGKNEIEKAKYRLNLKIQAIYAKSNGTFDQFFADMKKRQAEALQKSAQ